MTSEAQPCTVRNLDHTCIAVSDIQETMQFYTKLFDIGPVPVERGFGN